MALHDRGRTASPCHLLCGFVSFSPGPLCDATPALRSQWKVLTNGTVERKTEKGGLVWVSIPFVPY